MTGGSDAVDQARYVPLRPAGGLRLAAILVLAAVSLLAGSDLEITEQTIRRVAEQYGEDAGRRMRDWRDIIAENENSDEQSKLRAVNAFFNRLRPVTDQELWNKEDYWATPIEAIGRNGADCEDYSLAKYFTLRRLGVAEDKLHITYVKAVELNEAHMVLAYYATPQSEPLILDNLNEEILGAEQRLDLKPVYSFNGAGLWTSVNRARGKRVGPPGQIGLWKDFLIRLEQQLGSI